MERARGTAWLAFGVAVILLVSPVRLWWAQVEHGWLAPFGVWLAIIGMGAWQARRP